MKTIATLAALILITQHAATAGTINGTISHEKKTVKESQSLVVVWVEGLPANEVSTDKPILNQTGIQFSPRVLTVVAGQTVSFPNHDDVAHNVFSMSKAKRFKLGIYPKGETREVAFEKSGVIDLFCSIHRHMHAVIVVTPSEHVTESKLGENFSIDDVPPGTYTIKAWNVAHKLLTQEVTVPDTGNVEFTVHFTK